MKKRELVPKAVLPLITKSPITPPEPDIDIMRAHSHTPWSALE